MGEWLYVAEVGDRNERKIPANARARSWVVGSSGRLSAEVLTADLVRAGIMRPKSLWVRVFDDDLGTWGGVITAAEPSAGGTTEVAAIDWKGGLFDGRLVPRRAKALYGPAGSVSLATITATERGGRRLWIADRAADDLGLPVELTLDGGQLLDSLNSLQSASGQEYDVDMDTMAYRWGRIGRDLTGSVQLLSPRHIVDFSAPDSLDPVITVLRIYTAGNGQSGRAAEITALSADGVRQWGIREGTGTLDKTTAASAARRATQKMVDEAAAMGASLEFLVVNKDRCFRWFREGDTVCALLPEISSQMDIRVLARSQNDDGTLSVSAAIKVWTVF